MTPEVFIGVDLGTSLRRKSTGLAYLIKEHDEPWIKKRLRKHGIACYPSGAQWVKHWVEKGIELKRWSELRKIKKPETDARSFRMGLWLL